MKHLVTHLKVEVGKDVAITERKRYNVYRKRVCPGGSTISYHPPEVVCGGWRPSKMVDRSQLERVTCSRCKTYIAKFIR